MNAADDLFPGFEARMVAGDGADIFCRIGGSGPPLLLLHGFPETHAMWHRVAPRLAEAFTVIVADLRGYGQSSTPAPSDDHRAHSKRAMARDGVAIMAALGHRRFAVAGHDGARGSPTAWRSTRRRR